MPAFDPGALAAWTGGSWSVQPSDSPTGFSADSRHLARGHAFVALKTDRRDGHDFLGAALASGASAAIVAHRVPGVALPQLVVRDPLVALQAVAREHRRSFGGDVVAVTGSAGKTSTKEMVALLLGGEGAGVLATEGNLNNQIGVALTLTRLDPKLHRFAVVEAGISAPGEMAVLAAMIEPDVVIVTLVGPAHLADLGGLDGVAREKAALAGTLRPGGLCIFPRSCEGYPAFARLRRDDCLVLDPADGMDGRGVPTGRSLFAVSHSGGATEISVAFGGLPRVDAVLPRVTDGMAQNAALGICAALRLGVPGEQIAPRLRAWRPSPLRGEWKNSGGMHLFLDCYNANPASMADALGVFTAVAPPEEPRFFVIGCMEELGASALRYHVELGRTLPLRPGDRALVMGALAGAVREGALGGGCDEGQIEVAGSVQVISERLAGFQGSVFVKGSRRHELEKAFADLEPAEAHHA